MKQVLVDVAEARSSQESPPHPSPCTLRRPSPEEERVGDRGIARDSPRWERHQRMWRD